MQIGLTMFPTDYAIAPHELAKEAEARGFASLWLPEHTHIPASRKTPYPAGGELPQEYWHSYDPFGALCAAAAVTSKIELATGICLLIERDTITTAHEVATLDRLSNGRFLFGVGGGWNVEEMENHGTVYKTRFKKLREQVAACREIWTKEEAEFHGDFVKFDPIWCHPKPIQKKGPPVIMGGMSLAAIDRVIAYGDGWLPIDGGMGPDALAPLFTEFEKRVAASGRDRKSLSLNAYGVQQNAEALDKYRKLGFERAMFRLRPEARDVVLPKLDKLAGLARSS
ncbi:MAG TPA: LLM class F420-dependent oxidoreductase [Polyangiales bacterium]|nr:LLM class F420-dependent oxidoreductase [Polyangiales bacterium]